jgi:hypothetical protein
MPLHSSYTPALGLAPILRQIAETLKQFETFLMIKEAGVHGFSGDKCEVTILSLI